MKKITHKNEYHTGNDVFDVQARILFGKQCIWTQHDQVPKVHFHPVVTNQRKTTDSFSPLRVPTNIQMNFLHYPKQHSRKDNQLASSSTKIKSKKRTCEDYLNKKHKQAVDSTNTNLQVNKIIVKVKIKTRKQKSLTNRRFRTSPKTKRIIIITPLNHTAQPIVTILY